MFDPRFHKEDPEHPDKINAQAAFFSEVSSGHDRLHRRLRPVFPELKYWYKDGKSPFYELEALGSEWRRVDDLLIDNRGLCQPAVSREEAEDLLLLILDTLQRRFFSWSQPLEGEIACLERWEARLPELVRSIDGKVRDTHLSTEETRAAEWFEAILSVERFVLNGQILINAPTLIAARRTDETLNHAMQPPRRVFLHGDPHFGNIFVFFKPGDPLHLSALKFIDPNGQIGYGDIAYDLAKVRHSIHGRYDFLARGLFDWRLTPRPAGADASFDLVIPHDRGMNVRTPGGSGALSMVRGPSLTGGETLTYDHLSSRLFPLLRERIANDPDYAPLRDDRTLESRIRIYEALHFLTMPKFHMDGDGGSALKGLSMYLVGVQLLNDAMNNFDGSLKAERRTRKPRVQVRDPHLARVTTRRNGATRVRAGS